MAIRAISSITVLEAMFKTLSEVSTIKQMPKRLDDVFNIWGDLSLAISNYLHENTTLQRGKVVK